MCGGRQWAPWGCMILLVLAISGCASGGGKRQPDGEPEAGPTEEIEDYPLLDMTWEELLNYLEPYGPSPDGPDTTAVEWREPLGPYEDGSPWKVPEDFDFDFDFDQDFEWNLTANLVLMGSLVRTSSGAPPGFGRLGAHLNADLGDGSWLSVGLYYGEGTDSFGGAWSSQIPGIWEFGMDIHVRGNMDVRPSGIRTSWLMGGGGGFYRLESPANKFSSDNQVDYLRFYGGFALDYPMGKGVFLTGQATFGARWGLGAGFGQDWPSPMDEFGMEFCLDVGIIIPLSHSASF